MIQDEKCWVALNHSANMLIPWYLMASYMYYWHDNPILTDGLFDLVCKRLRAEYHLLVHTHKSYVRRSDLRAGTCSMAEDDYPSITKSTAWRLADEQPPKKPARVKLVAPPKPTRVRLEKPTRVRLL